MQPVRRSVVPRSVSSAGLILVCGAVLACSEATAPPVRPAASPDAAVVDPPDMAVSPAPDMAAPAPAPRDGASPPSETEIELPAIAGCPSFAGQAPTEHGSVLEALTKDETWAAGPHLVTYHFLVRKGGTLTVAPCATVRVRAGYRIDVAEGGTLIAEGTREQPITFQGESLGGKWRPLEVFAGSLIRLRHVTISGAGEDNDVDAAALSLRGDGKVATPLARVQHVTITGAPRFGVRLELGSLFTADSENLTVTGAGLFPVVAHPGSAGSLPRGSYKEGNSSPEILIPDGAIYWDVTWRDLGVPYHIGRPGTRNAVVQVNADTRIGSAPTVAVPRLTLEPGVVLRFETGSRLEIEHQVSSTPVAATGALHAVGTAARPVVFTSAAAAPAAGDWTGIIFGGIADPLTRVEHARIEYAGADASSLNGGCERPASIGANMNRAGVLIFAEPASAFVTNTTIAHSAADGFARVWVGSAVDFLPSNTFDQIAWCHQSFPRPSGVNCPAMVPCPR